MDHPRFLIINLQIKKCQPKRVRIILIWALMTWN